MKSCVFWQVGFWAQGTIYYMGVQTPNWKWQFLGFSQPTEQHCKSLLRYMQQKINNDISVTVVSLLRCFWLGVTLTFPREKSAHPLRCGLSSKFFDHLLLLCPHVPQEKVWGQMKRFLLQRDLTVNALKGDLTKLTILMLNTTRKPPVNYYNLLITADS